MLMGKVEIKVEQIDDADKEGAIKNTNDGVNANTNTDTNTKDNAGIDTSANSKSATDNDVNNAKDAKDSATNNHDKSDNKTTESSSKIRINDVFVKKKEDSDSEAKKDTATENGSIIIEKSKDKKIGRERIKHKKTERTKSNKGLLLGVICLGCVAVVAIVAVIIIKLTPPTLDEEFFVSDDTKTTITLTPDSDTAKTNELSVVKSHVVYDYNGDNVVGMKTYFEYKSEHAAEQNLEMIKSQPQYSKVELNGNYIIATSKEDQFKGLTASDIKQQAEAMEIYMRTKNKTETPEESPENT